MLKCPRLNTVDPGMYQFEHSLAPLAHVQMGTFHRVHTGKYEYGVKFKDSSRTSQSISNSFQGLKVNEKYWSKC